MVRRALASNTQLLDEETRRQLHAAAVTELELLKARHEIELPLFAEEVERLKIADTSAQNAARDAREALCRARANLFGEQIGYEHRHSVLSKQISDLDALA